MPPACSRTVTGGALGRVAARKMLSMCSIARADLDVYVDGLSVVDRAAIQREASDSASGTHKSSTSAPSIDRCSRNTTKTAR
jgi:hypothetical protein